MDEDIAEQLAIRDSYRRKLHARMTPEERMAKFWELQEFLFDQLKRSPNAYEWFWRRNIAKRAIPHSDYPPSTA
jgi:hypothetical protein